MTTRSIFGGCDQVDLLRCSIPIWKIQATDCSLYSNSPSKENKAHIHTEKERQTERKREREQRK